MVPGLAVICISLIVTVFPVLSTWQLKLILLAATIYASFPSACSVLATSIHLMRDPSAGYEYVDNRPLAEALLHIPVEGALLATNDIRYPAENYLRKERQYQFAALFGHRNFGTDLSYLNPPENLVRRARFVTRVLDNENPGKDDLDVLVNKYGITHFVIHKRDEKKHNLPFQMIFENSKYAVYYTQGKGLL